MQRVIQRSTALSRRNLLPKVRGHVHMDPLPSGRIASYCSRANDTGTISVPRMDGDASFETSESPRCDAFSADDFLANLDNHTRDIIVTAIDTFLTDLHDRARGNAKPTTAHRDAREANCHADDNDDEVGRVRTYPDTPADAPGHIAELRREMALLAARVSGAQAERTQTQDALADLRREVSSLAVHLSELQAERARTYDAAVRVLDALRAASSDAVAPPTANG